MWRCFPILTGEFERSRRTLVDRLMLAALVMLLLILHPSFWLSSERPAAEGRGRI
jgi:hypothetical protein